MLAYLKLILLITSFSAFVSGDCINQFWKYYDGACYYSMTGIPNYAKAKETCDAMNINATVVTIHSAAEQNFLNSEFGTMKYYIGLENSASNLWQWVDQSPYVYSNWASTPSKSGCPMANYAGSIGQWTTVNCNIQYSGNQGTICKYYTSAVANTTCADLTDANNNTNCPQIAEYCNKQLYFDLMTEQCPYTCNRCPGQEQNCTDLLGQNGTTDCPQKAYLCNNTVYYDYMTEQCPFTCKRCPPRTQTASCVDLTGPNGISDCAEKAYLCNNTVYYDYMTEQCPKTCNRCP